MKIRYKYFNPIIVFLIVYMFGLLIFSFSLGAVRWTHTYLNHILPDLFPKYNVIHDPDAYEKMERIFSVTGVFVALVLINLIALKLENKKYERMISLTDGQYLLKDGTKLYFGEFWITDLITSTLIPALLVIHPYFISDKFMGYFGLIIPSWMGYELKEIMPLPLAMICVALFSYVGRVLSALLCVKSWRAAWLSDI